jgi:hypothetical protein
MKLEYFRQIFENTQTPKLMKILPLVAELFHSDGQMDGRTYVHTADRQTDRDMKVIVAFRDVANVPNIASYVKYQTSCP